MQFERWLKDKKVTEYLTMRKKTVVLSIGSWLCSTLVGSSSDINLQLGMNRLEIGLINLILGGIYKYQFQISLKLGLKNIFMDAKNQ